MDIYARTISLSPNKCEFIAINFCVAMQQNCTEDNANGYQKDVFPLNQNKELIKPHKITCDTEKASKIIHQ